MSQVDPDQSETGGDRLQRNEERKLREKGEKERLQCPRGSKENEKRSVAATTIILTTVELLPGD